MCNIISPGCSTYSNRILINNYCLVLGVWIVNMQLSVAYFVYNAVFDCMVLPHSAITFVHVTFYTNWWLTTLYCMNMEWSLEWNMEYRVWEEAIVKHVDYSWGCGWTQWAIAKLPSPCWCEFHNLSLLIFIAMPLSVSYLPGNCSYTTIMNGSFLFLTLHTVVESQSSKCKQSGIVITVPHLLVFL